MRRFVTTALLLAGLEFTSVAAEEPVYAPPEGPETGGEDRAKAEAVAKAVPNPKTFTSSGLNKESNCDWEREQWYLRLNVFAQQLLKVGKQPLALQLGGGYYAGGPSGGRAWAFA